MVCGSPLEYLEQSQPLTCAYCGKTEPGYIKCPQSHYICDSCHNMGSMQAIEDIAFTTRSEDPIEIAELMMSHPELPMLGCQHAFIAAGALMAAIKNNGFVKITNEDIKEAFKRVGRQAIGGYCGLTGVCGVTPAIGACFSILFGAKCGKDIEQKITMEAATRVSRAITDITGPSCCKAYVRTALDVAVDVIQEVFNRALPIHDATPSCVYIEKHPHGCRGDKCPYFPKDTTYVTKAPDHVHDTSSDC